MTTRTIERAAALLATALLLIAAAAPGSASAATLPADTTALLSGAPSLLDALPAPVGRADLTTRSVSQDGRWVAFSSSSDGLVDGDDDRVVNVYRKDTTTGEVTLVSRATGANGEPSHARCFDAAISDSGQTVAFTCDGPLDPADANDQADVYVRTPATGTTTLVSRRPNGGPAGDRASASPVLSADGSHVAYTSYAGDLVPSSGEGARVFRTQLLAAPQTVLVSRGLADAPVQGYQPSISDDGNRIAFTSPAAAAAGDGNGKQDVYLRDVTAGTTALVSRASGTGGAVGNGESSEPAIAGNGSAIAFESTANQFDNAADPDTQPDVYRRALGSSTTTLVDVSAGGVKATRAARPTIDDSGNVVGFVARGAQLHPDDTGAAADAYVKDLATNTVHVASRASGANGAVANAEAENVALSGDGTKAATELERAVTPDGDPRRRSVILRDLASATTRLVSRPAGTAPFVGQGGDATAAALSADGRYAAFVSDASGLGLPAQAESGVFVRDRVTGDVTLASRADGPDGAAFAGPLADPAISADGRRVAFTGAPQRDGRADVWVRDLATGTTWAANRADGAGGAPGDGPSGDPALDGDGTRVAFVSEAKNLGDGDADERPDVHVRDLESGVTILASRAGGAAGAKADAAATAPDIDAAGTKVVFATAATNLGAEDTDGVRDVHLRDLAEGTTRLVSGAPGGPKSDGDSPTASISADGARVAFASGATNLPGGDGAYRVFVRDLAAGALLPVARGDDPVISPDGGHVAFEGPLDEVMRHDLAAGRTDVASRASGADGVAAEQWSTVGDISEGGRCVSFATGSALVGPPRDTTESYLRAFAADCAAPAPPGGPPAGGGGNDGGPGGPGVVEPSGPGARDTVAPVLSGVRLSARRFRARRGTTLSFRSSEAATLSVSVERRRRVRGRTVHRRAGALSRRVAAGTGRIRLTARIGRRRLAPGRYRLTVVARDAAGNRSRPVRLAFAIVRGGR